MTINLESGYTLHPFRTGRGQTEALILSFESLPTYVAPVPHIFVSRAEAAELAGKIRALLDSDNANLSCVVRAVTRLDGYEGHVSEGVLIEGGEAVDATPGIFAVVGSEVSKGTDQCAIRLMFLRYAETRAARADNEPLTINCGTASLAMFGLNLERALYPTLEAEIVDRLANIETLLEGCNNG